MCATATGIPSLVIGDSCAIKLTVCLMGKFVFNYRPQRSWGNVMFLQASVILLMGGGVPPPGGVCSQGGVCSGVSARGGGGGGAGGDPGGTHPTGMHSCS